jgi:hypothetical protein
MITIEKYFRDVYRKLSRESSMKNMILLVYQRPDKSFVPRIGLEEHELVRDMIQEQYRNHTPLLTSFDYICAKVDGPLKKTPKKRIQVKK